MGLDGPLAQFMFQFAPQRASFNRSGEMLQKVVGFTFQFAPQASFNPQHPRRRCRKALFQFAPQASFNPQTRDNNSNREAVSIRAAAGVILPF